MYHFNGTASGTPQPYPPPQYTGYPPNQQPHPSQSYPTLQTAHNGNYAASQQAPQWQHPGYQPSHSAQPLPYGSYQTNQQSSNQQNQAGMLPNHNQAPAPQSSTTQSCYNCGGVDHVAQNCPEPRRAVPAGAMNNSRPLKRQKTSGPVITRYPPPPGYNQSQGPQRSFTHPPISQYPFPPRNGPPIPMSMSPDRQQYSHWQQQQQHPASYDSPGAPLGLEVHRSHSFTTPAVHNGGHHYMSHSVPTPVSSYGPPHGSPASSVRNYHQQSVFTSPSSAGPLQASPVRQASFGSANDALSAMRAQRYPNISKQSHTSLDHEQEALDDPSMEELNSLDFSEDKPSSGPVVWHPANPVAQPLPSTMFEADAIGRLPIAATLPPGVPVSRYFRDLNNEIFEQNILQTEGSIRIDGDPAFAEISFDCDCISLSELVKRRNEMTVAIEEYDDDAEDGEVNHSEERYEGVEEQDLYRDFSNRGTPELAEAELIDVQALVELAETEEERFARLQEEKLAALGVEGFAKPVQPSMRRSIAVSETTFENLEQEVDQSINRSRSTSYDHKQQAQSRDLSGGFSPTSINGHSRALSFTGNSSRHTGSSAHSPQESPPTHGESRRERHYSELRLRTDSYNASRPPPPPPPPPPPKPRYLDGSSSLHDSPNDFQRHSSPVDEPKNPSTNVNTLPDRNGSMSPSYRSRSDPALSRKRSYRHSSEESDGGPKRQEDEITQRNKRRQPVVAAAYSRRW